MLHLIMEEGLAGLKPSQASDFQFLPLTVIPTCLLIDPKIDLLQDFIIRYLMHLLIPLTRGKWSVANFGGFLKVSGIQRLGLTKIMPNLITFPE